MQSVDLDNLKPKENFVMSSWINVIPGLIKTLFLKVRGLVLTSNLQARSIPLEMQIFFEASNFKMRVGEFQVCGLKVCELRAEEFANCEL